MKKQPEFTAFLPVLPSVSALCSDPLLFPTGKAFSPYRKKKKKWFCCFFPQKVLMQQQGAFINSIDLSINATPARPALLLAEGLVVLCQGELGAQLCDISPGELLSSLLGETKPE